ncbi:hypothetical protein WMY93_008267 [Mugilogobius chulae]|uniref:Uncharacterized protein n=1 Tax=Mugilogobius chulae TaxID=88201 RepID=A0AAW0PS05_9GOBI
MRLQVRTTKPQQSPADLLPGSSSSVNIPGGAAFRSISPAPEPTGGQLKRAKAVAQITHPSYSTRPARAADPGAIRQLNFTITSFSLFSGIPRTSISLLCFFK